MALTSDEIRKLLNVTPREYRSLMGAVYSGTKPDIRPLVRFIFDKVSDAMEMNNEYIEGDIEDAVAKKQ